MEAVQVFDYETSKLRVVLHDVEPWFVVKDVCDALGIADVSRAVNGNSTRGESGLDEDEKGTYTVRTPGGPQRLLCLNEYEIYSLVFKSRKTEAKLFQRWVTHDVLPSIRKTGQYHIQSQYQLPQTYLEALEALVVSEQEKVFLQERTKELEPKAQAYDTMLSGDNAQTMAEVAKFLGTGRNRLFDILREQRVLLPNTLPYQEYLDRGYFKVRQVPVKRSQGVMNKTQTLVTAKGVDFIHKLLFPQLESIS